MSTTPDTEANHALRNWRIANRLTQQELAERVRTAGQQLGVHVETSARTVQRWESGAVQTLQPAHQRALEHATGQLYEALGFTPRVRGDDDGGQHVAYADNGGIPEPTVSPETRPEGSYSGIWLSRYEYYSSSRASTFVGAHYVLLLQHGTHLTIRSLPNAASSPGSELTMNLEVDQQVLTGTWNEHTSPTDYYKGATYHGAVQLLIELTGNRIAGKWIGFGKDFEINSGPWELILQDHSTTRKTLDTYSTTPTQ